MFLAMYRVPVLSRVASVVTRLFGRDERRRVLVLAILMVLGTALPAILGWAVREIGRKPWTVYGLLHPQEVISPVNYVVDPIFLAFAYIVVIGVNAFGLYAMYLVATREYRFLDMLRSVVKGP